MFMAIAFAILGCYVVVVNGRSTPLLIGFLIGVSAMMSELFFVLMAIFFTLGEIATTNHYSESDCSNNSLCLTLFYGQVQHQVIKHMQCFLYLI